MTRSSIAAHVRRVVAALGRDDRTRNVARRLYIGGSAIALTTLLVALPVSGRESHSLPGYYAGGLTAESSWDEILKAGGVQPQWPLLSFGNAMVPISNVCLSKDDDTLAISDRRSDNGVRLSADEFREQARVAMAKGPATRRDQLARLAGGGPSGPSAPEAGLIRYPVSVYRPFRTTRNR
jgi:hypothetical protein